jgi:hypothetical protein
VLGLITVVVLTLGLWNLRYGLPVVLHSDFIQAKQAVALLNTGSFLDTTNYPPTLVFAYTASDLLAYGVGHVAGWDGYADWTRFLAHLSQRSVHHAIGRVFGAVMAALLCIAVYRLARVRFDRRVSVLAAAIAGVCPLQTLHAHQIRPHIAVLTVLVFLAPAVLRLAQRPSVRGALTAGLAAGLVNSVFQVGLPLLVVALGFVLLYARPFRAMLVQGLCVLGGFVVGWQAIMLGMHSTGMLAPGKTSYMTAQTFWSAREFGLESLMAGVGRVPEQWWQWILTEPLRALAVVLFLALCLAGARSWRDALLYGAFPLVVLLVLALLQGVHVRYAMYATPFLAVLAASSVCAARKPAWRVVFVVLLLAAPLSTSMRINRLLGLGDTRLSLLDALPDIANAGLRVTITANLAPSGASVAKRVQRFPPRGDFRPWLNGDETPKQTFLAAAPDVFARQLRANKTWEIGPKRLRQLGYERAGQVGADGILELDAPRRLLPDVWQITRPGPAVEVWARAALVNRVRALLPADMRVRPVD